MTMTTPITLTRLAVLAVLFAISTALPLTLHTRDYDDVDLPNGAAGPYSEGGYKPPDARASLITAGVFGFLGLVGVGVFFYLWRRLRRENEKEDAALRALRAEMGEEGEDPQSPDSARGKGEDGKGGEGESENRIGWRRMMREMVGLEEKDEVRKDTREDVDGDAQGKRPEGLRISVQSMEVREVPPLRMPLPPAKAVMAGQGRTISVVPGTSRA
ncbi:hypothetical protein BZA05DRAFT_188374 [Tricharina praecox]|uniref:uncharacterized protein n=1 Tax=Tricharina praecox TaxID=43433 RepID=UPI0022202FDA|nr:uncharacterized protein BZA05DRAFT_188374 [Tricharina praecox]KAI5842813.1 hypothetical protein BZA05DRAFT_188374 [Tricharina praecox]